MNIEEKAKYYSNNNEISSTTTINEDVERGYIAGYEEAVNSINWHKIGNNFLSWWKSPIKKDFHLTEQDITNFFKEQIEKQLK